MNNKELPFTKKQIENISKKYPTPFHLYDEKGIRENVRRLINAFNIFPGFKEYFAVKATPNPFIMKILKEEGCGADCSSLPELLLSEKAGIIGEDIMFTSNDTPIEEYEKAKDLGAVINLDDISHIEFIDKEIGLPELVSFRLNPGPERSGNVIIGDPKEAKYGFTREQLFEGYQICKEKGVKRFGLHTMVVSNELNVEYLIETAKMLFKLAAEIKDKFGIYLEFVNLGGGIGIPYKPEDEVVDYGQMAAGVKKAYDNYAVPAGLTDLKVYMECGRVITGPYGYLITKVLHMKHTYKNYAGCDASMANLMRPGVYGAYHHITILGKEDQIESKTYDVTGSLCENNDKFAIDRKLPPIEKGDLLAIHDSGAHGHSMGFNYNGKTRAAELLLCKGGSVELIRRAETVEDYFATLDFEKLKTF